MKAVIGVGSSGSNCVFLIQRALLRIQTLPEVKVLGISPIFENPASGGITLANFANAAVLLHMNQSLERLWQNLHAIERQQGRVRLLKNGPRTIDLDILWADHAPAQNWLQVPHPRLFERDFALLPALAAFEKADEPAPMAWEKAAHTLKGLSRLRTAIL